MRKILYLLIVGAILLNCKESKAQEEVYKSESLLVYQVSDHVYEHVSYLDTESFGKVPCNGMIIAKDNEAVVFDTTVDDETSSELIDWIKRILKCKIIAVIPTHYHEDNLGGLKEFHKHGIPSYAYQKTIEIMRGNGGPDPQNGFDGFLELSVGNERVYVEFLGEGHTCDNVIGYFPSDAVMFGGCLVKEIGAGKGNLEEANVAEWPETIRKLKATYGDAKVIIPGHGKSGGVELLDYTINLFSVEKVTNRQSVDYKKPIDSLLNVYSTKPFNGIVLITQNGKVVYSKVCGYSDLDNKTPLKISDQFVVGSVSKQFTAAIVLQEYDKGLLDLYIPIKKYLPDLTESWADTVTVHHLLNFLLNYSINVA